jgi:hypothetical protein
MILFLMPVPVFIQGFSLRPSPPPEIAGAFFDFPVVFECVSVQASCSTRFDF